MLGQQQALRIGRAAAVLALAAAAPVAVAQQVVLEGKTAEQAYKNIQVLNGTPAQDLNQTMHIIAGDLGVECEFCHIATDRSKDDLKPKHMARRMIMMVNDLNKNWFGGRQIVTCYTCHQGHPEPTSLPAFPLVLAEKPWDPPLPTVEDILSKYVQALGGEQAIRRVTSRVITATQDIPSGAGGLIPLPTQKEEYFKAPNFFLNVYHAPTYTISDGYDGQTKWSQNNAEFVTDAVKLDQNRTKRSADFYESVDLKQEYSKLTVVGIERVNNHDAWVVVGTVADDAPERLYFDTRTALLLRKATILLTPAGNSPFEVDYDDYRDTGSGVKIPFWIRMYPATPRSHLETYSTIQVQTVKDNVPIDNSKFTKPQSPAEH